MSDPKRYSRRDIYDVTYQAAGDECLPEPSENGEYVLWEDYARLKAELERYKFTLEEERQIARQDWAGLRCEHDRVKRALEHAEAELTNLKSEADRFKAEVERLRIEPELEQRCRELNLSLAQQAIQLRQIGELKAEVENFKEYLKWHADEHKFNEWEVWRRQQSDAGNRNAAKDGEPTE